MFGPRRTVRIVEQTQTTQSPSASTSSRKSREDFSIPPIKRIVRTEEADELYYEYDSDDEYDYSSEFIPLKKHLRNHPFHPNHSLTLCTDQEYGRRSCNACSQIISGAVNARGRFYSCDQSSCGFKMDTVCASLRPTLHDTQVLHPHPLCFFPLDWFIYYRIPSKWFCSACGDTLGNVVVRCVLCDLNLHLRCHQTQQLPEPISFTAIEGGPQNTFYITSDYSLEPLKYCFVCRRQFWPGSTYYQSTGQVLLAHIGCALTVCGFKLECPIILFYKNIPLPERVDDPKCHFHTLTLKPRLVEVEEGHLGKEHYCDACEEQRDPNDCLYYCHPCKFEVHVKCVRSEIRTIIEQKPLDVKWVQASKLLEDEQKLKLEKESNDRIEEESKVENCPTLEQVLSSYNQEDDEVISDICKALETITWDSIFGKSSKYDVSERVLYSDDPMIKFTTKLNSTFTSGSNSTLEETKQLVFKFLKNQYGGEHVVDVGEHQVTRNFATILEGLLAKHGNFCASCALSPRMKMLFCVVFCEVVHKMCNTWFKDVTEDLLIEWWKRLNMVRSAGFQIQFTFKCFRRVVYAYFGHQADDKVYEKITKVRTELDEIPDRIQKLKLELKKEEERLEMLKNEKKLIKEAFWDKKSRLMKECLFEFEEIICDRAGLDLL